MKDNGLEYGIADIYLEKKENDRKLKNMIIEELIKQDEKYKFLKDYIDSLEKENKFNESQATNYFKEKNHLEYERDSYKLLSDKLQTKLRVELRLRKKISLEDADKEINDFKDRLKNLYNISKDI